MLGREDPQMPLKCCKGNLYVSGYPRERTNLGSQEESLHIPHLY